MASTTTPAQPRFHCRHVFTSGHRCGSPALRQEHFCFYHHNARKPTAERHQAAEQSSRRRAAFTLPSPEDRSAVQAAIGQVLVRLANNELDARRAGLLLYGLQIASLNLPPQKLPIDPAETVDEVVEDPLLGSLAPPSDFNDRLHREKTLEEIILGEWNREQAQPGPAERPEDLIPTIQAAAQPPRQRQIHRPAPAAGTASGAAQPASSDRSRTLRDHLLEGIRRHLGLSTQPPPSTFFIFVLDRFIAANNPAGSSPSPRLRPARTPAAPFPIKSRLNPELRLNPPKRIL
jgi:hypothetical protein